MDFYDNEERRKAITNHIAKLRDIAALYPVIVPVITEFDNKIYNVRFKNAIHEAASSSKYYVFTEKRLNYIEIYVYDRGSQFTLAQVTIDDMPDSQTRHTEFLPAVLKIPRPHYPAQCSDSACSAQTLHRIRSTPYSPSLLLVLPYITSLSHGHFSSPAFTTGLREQSKPLK